MRIGQAMLSRKKEEEEKKKKKKKKVKKMKKNRDQVFLEPPFTIEQAIHSPQSILHDPSIRSPLSPESITIHHHSIIIH